MSRLGINRNAKVKCARCTASWRRDRNLERMVGRGQTVRCRRCQALFEIVKANDYADIQDAFLYAREASAVPSRMFITAARRRLEGLAAG